MPYSYYHGATPGSYTMTTAQVHALTTVGIILDSYQSAANNAYVAGTSGAALDNFTLTIAAVPEPSTYTMMLGGLGLLIVLRRIGKRKA